MQHKAVQDRIQESKKILVEKKILGESVLKKPVLPTTAASADNKDWRYWSASYLFTPGV
jgi:hypothetical protein